MASRDKANVGINLFAEGGNIQADVKAWKMKSIYPKTPSASK